MDRTLQPISFAGSPLAEVHYICAFFADDDAEYRGRPSGQASRL
jgi:hypothetical protein